MGNKELLCPIAKDYCVEELCGWYAEEIGTCSVKLIARHYVISLIRSEKSRNAMTTEFFLPMKPPTTTHQKKQVNWKAKTFYEPGDVKATRAKLIAHLGQHVPEEKYTGAVRLITKWCFPITGKHYDGEYKTSKPDTDNLQKMLKDVMTDLKYWTDDAQVASEIIEKFWAAVPGIYIRIEDLCRESAGEREDKHDTE